jgi:hypothetical protein
LLTLAEMMSTLPAPSATPALALVTARRPNRHAAPEPWKRWATRQPARTDGKSFVHEWLRRAEQLAGLPRLDPGIWHPYRRKWATARKHLPAADVAAAGGWKSTLTLTKCYQQAVQATMLTAVLGGAELREKKA